MDPPIDIPFDKYEKRGAYHWEWYRDNKHAYRQIVDTTVAYFPCSGSVLDIGCGDGLISYKLHERGLHVTGIDINHTAIELARRQIAARVVRGSIPQIIRRLICGLPSKETLADLGIDLRHVSIDDLSASVAYDYVLCHEVIEHVPNPSDLIRKAVAVTKCWAIFTTPNGQFSKKHELDYNQWDLEGFLALFVGLDVTVVEVTPQRLVVRVNAGIQ